MACLSLSSLAQQKIAPNNKTLTFKGTQYVTASKDRVSFSRFSPELMEMTTKDLGFQTKKALTTSGVRLLFSTDSSTITCDFTTSAKEENRGADFAIFANEKMIKEFTFQKPKTAKMQLTFKAPKTGFNNYEITLPSWANASFTGLGINDSSTLKPYTYDKPIYVAVGDSISHGVGQRSATHLTWPFKLSRQMNADLYNVAVGGGKISLPVAQQLSTWDKIDIMTILIGYNDWCFNGKTPEQFKLDYKAFLDTIRTKHPSTKIFCISPLYTRTTESKKTKQPIQPIRQVVYDLVAQRQAAGDKNIFLIKGETLTSEANLREDQKSDPVHLGIKGADMLAKELQQIIKLKL